MNNIGIKNKNFSSNSFDFTRTFSVLTKNKKSIFDNLEGYGRLLENEKFVNRQIADLKSKVNRINGKFRYLIELPDDFPENNLLREILTSIQKKAGIKVPFIQTSKKETFEIIDDYLDSFEGEFILVLDMEMEFRDLSRLVEKYLPKCKEIVLVYREWSENKNNFNFVLQKSKSNPNKFHMSSIPIEIYAGRNNNELISTLLICSDFKSVSFIDSEFPRYLYKYIKSNKTGRSQKEKLENSQWVNSVLMSFETNHREECNCLGNDLNKLIKKVSYRSIITFHNLEDLAGEYSKIKRSINKKQEVLNLESMQSLMKSLGVAQTS